MLNQASYLGFDRVSFVRVVERGSHRVYEVVGVRRRRPVTQAVPAPVALKLVRAGVPQVCRTGRTA